MSQDRYPRKSAARGAQQYDMGITAKPEMQILYLINPKVSYMIVNIL